jgi:hypothetical protein
VYLYGLVSDKKVVPISPIPFMNREGMKDRAAAHAMLPRSPMDQHNLSNVPYHCLDRVVSHV